MEGLLYPDGEGAEFLLPQDWQSEVSQSVVDSAKAQVTMRARWRAEVSMGTFYREPASEASTMTGW